VLAAALRRLAVALATGLALAGVGAANSAADPVIAAAGDIGCDPTDPGYNGGAGTADRCQQRARGVRKLGLMQQERVRIRG
jgi:hypothetical protein